jgi:hypothetical protein
LHLLLANFAVTILMPRLNILYLRTVLKKQDWLRTVSWTVQGVRVLVKVLVLCITSQMVFCSPFGRISAAWQKFYLIIV